MKREVNSANSEAVFVMGLPRSGSTLLSRLLNNSPDILSVNDLYFLQAVLANGVVEGTMTDAQTEALVDQLLKVIATRAKANQEFIGQFRVAPERIQDIRQEVLGRQKHAPYTWYDLLNVLLNRVAESVGKTRWADKTPQNFYHFHLLAERFPAARFIFLFRDPRSILASYKFARGEGHDVRRYHPVVYSLYWRSAIRYFQKVKDNPRIMMLRYEDLLADTSGACDRLGNFLDTDIKAPELDSLGHNSSFGKGGRKDITQTEAWICQRLCGQEMRNLAYPLKASSPHFTELPVLIGLSIKFSFFQLGRLLGDNDARKRIITFMRGLRNH